MYLIIIDLTITLYKPKICLIIKENTVKKILIGVGVAAATAVGAAWVIMGVKYEVKPPFNQDPKTIVKVGETVPDNKEPLAATYTSDNTQDVTPKPVVTENVSSPQVETVTISSYELVPEGNNQRCNLTYSDGSTYSFLHTQWSSDGKAMATNGVCDDTLIGKEKQDTFTGY